MIEIKKNVDLKPYNTFGIQVNADAFVEVNSIADFKELFSNEIYKTSKRLIIGGGSNVLFTDHFRGLVIKNNLKGIELIKDEGDTVIVKAAAGENWHTFVLWSLDQNYSGLENLSLIPGCVGASPMQNIGAYGVEIKDVFDSLEAYSLIDGALKSFNKQECEFGYRESVFKRKLKDEYFITSVSFRLRRSKQLNTSYGAINAELEAMQIKSPGVKDVSNAVINIRQSKLPDPKVLGNAGSFFKNPEVSKDTHDRLKSEFPDLVAYNLGNGNFKLAAGWLIEKSGLKGFELNGAAVHDKQALVLVNKQNASGQTIYKLSTVVIETVYKMFGVLLEREVNIIS